MSLQNGPASTLEAGLQAGANAPAGVAIDPATNQPYPPTVTAGGQFNIQAYIQARPDLLNNYTSDPGYAQVYGSLAKYALADAAANGGAQITALIAANDITDSERRHGNTERPRGAEYRRRLESASRQQSSSVSRLHPNRRGFEQYECPDRAGASE